ncbi:binding partner of ACD11 1-like [Thalictrum thalictroides]|uniref:Binding partner of ACD11 1-like n=1 Tax=Thalictrum thalictroides TaxID=46969 RepID=A0A7J6XAQ8_THATH|nr:binding partner of ACD11 1-like [Thalictrum thalictroides]
MSVPMEQSDPKDGGEPQLAASSNWTIDFDLKIRTVKVSNISLAATDLDIKEFFSFSGNIQHIELQSESEKSQFAYVTFKNSQGADTALLLSGSTIKDLPVTITPVDNYLLPPEVSSETKDSSYDSTVRKAEDVVSGMLAKGFILGKDALNKAKSFDERHHLISNASATVASIDKKMGLTEKIGIGTAVVNEKVREVDELFQVSEMTRLALAAAEQKASSASSALLSNQYVATGASWVSGALNKVAGAAGAVSYMTREKVEKAEEEKEAVYKEKTGVVNDFSQLHLDVSPAEQPPIVPLDSSVDSKLGNI